jgi:predicted amidohydrolase
MRVAAYQAPLLPNGSLLAVELVRRQLLRCESDGIDVLCCPEALPGGLADDALDPKAAAINISAGHLDELLAPLASDRVTTVIGFTEISGSGELFNSAAVFHRGSVLGTYRKQHPALRASVYSPGSDTRVFRIPGLCFGILICNDSNFPELATSLVASGAGAVFIPTNNTLPPERADVVRDVRRVDCAIATHNRVWVIRADVAGSCDGRVSYGSSGIVGPRGQVVRSARPLVEELLVAEID